jgi:hypothetical protein
MPNKSRFRGRVFLLSERDVQILNFIWKWKLATTSTIHHAIIRPGSAYSAYKALERLADHGYVKSFVCEEHRFTAWQLTEKGFSAIKNSLGELSEEGYLSANPNHDLHSLAFQLGEWSWYKFPIALHFTEQELRRRPADLYPSWVPNAVGHRADGYSRIEGKNRTWVYAFEVEFAQKAVGRYESVIRYYRSQRHVDRVFWLIADPEIKSKINLAKANMKDEQDTYHVFVDVNDYQKNGWDAMVTNERSENLFTIRGHMRAILGDLYGQYLGTIEGQSKVTDHYNPIKVIGKPRG